MQINIHTNYFLLFSKIYIELKQFEKARETIQMGKLVLGDLEIFNKYKDIIDQSWTNFSE